MENSDNNDGSETSRQASRQHMNALPSNMLSKEFGKVYVGEQENKRQIEFTIWSPELSGAQAEGWRTGLAIDASASMKDWFGQNLVSVGDGIPTDVLTEYEKKGWARRRSSDGEDFLSLENEAVQDAMKRNLLKNGENIVQPLTRDFIAYLSSNLDAKGCVSVAYWACGDGSDFEPVGEITADDSKTVDISGPNKFDFGAGTKLAPVLDYFCRQYEDATNAMFVFITDGRLDDLQKVKEYTSDIARNIANNNRNLVKCVLIGVGNEIDEKQMIELDDLDTGVDIDIWDHKIAKEMRALSEIMVELVDEIVSNSPAMIYDDNGDLVKQFSDGLPASASFTMPLSSKYFELEVGDYTVRQSIMSGS